MEYNSNMWVQDLVDALAPHFEEELLKYKDQESYKALRLKLQDETMAIGLDEEVNTHGDSHWYGIRNEYWDKKCERIRYVFEYETDEDGDEIESDDYPYTEREAFYLKAVFIEPSGGGKVFLEELAKRKYKVG